MDKKMIFLISALLAAVIITGVSFFMVKSIPGAFQEILEYDRAEPIYNEAGKYLRSGEKDKAVAAFFTVMNKYPESKYAEKSMRTMIDTHLKDGDHEKAGYYSKRLLESFPNIKDKDKIRSAIGDANIKMLISPEIQEGSIEYVIQPGDTLSAIARRFNTTVELIRKINGIQGDIIRSGQKIKIVISKFSILADKSENILILKKDGKQFKTYTISTGKDNSTPVGIFKIEEKMVKPVWYKVDAIISPDSKEYELGERWMGLSVEGYGIHGTSDEKTIGSQVTQGCIRMYNKDVIELFDIVPSGTEVEIVD
ncbi:MAG: L,D-transpeptidase family protein [Candidatus Omnitrophota bacterium]